MRGNYSNCSSSVEPIKLSVFGLHLQEIIEHYLQYEGLMIVQPDVTTLLQIQTINFLLMFILIKLLVLVLQKILIASFSVQQKDFSHKRQTWRQLFRSKEMWVKWRHHDRWQIIWCWRHLCDHCYWLGHCVERNLLLFLCRFRRFLFVCLNTPNCPNTLRSNGERSVGGQLFYTNSPSQYRSTTRFNVAFASFVVVVLKE